MPESVLSDALNERGRNLEADWILAQGSDFVTVWIEAIEKAMGLTQESRRTVKAQRISELIRLLVEEVA